MQKALLQMNLQLSQVLSAITGQTGLLIMRAIVAGEWNPQKLAGLRNWRCQKDETEIAEALTGTWREEHLFVLKQSLAMYDFYTEQLAECDRQIERTFSLIKPRWGAIAEEETAIMAAGGGKKDNRGRNAPEQVQSRAHIKRITGIDLVVRARARGKTAVPHPPSALCLPIPPLCFSQSLILHIEMRPKHKNEAAKISPG